MKYFGTRGTVLCLLLVMLFFSCELSGSASGDLSGAVQTEDDSDGDGILNGVEDVNRNNVYSDDDTDNDGTPNYQDTDDDGDDIFTLNERGDTDEDGIPDYLESNLDNLDGDEHYDYDDSDDDGDGISTKMEDVNGNGWLFDDDSDGDGTIDAHDTDDDEDGVPTAAESSDDHNGNGIDAYLDPTE